MKQLPGVHSASYSSFTPISGKEVGINVVVDGYALRPGEVANEDSWASRRNISTPWAFRYSLGRDFSEADVHPDSAVESFHDRSDHQPDDGSKFLCHSSPLGKHFHFVEGNRPPLEIVGVVADSKYNDLREGPADFFYIPGTHGELEIRTSGPTKTLAGPLREIFTRSITRSPSQASTHFANKLTNRSIPTG